MITIQDIIKKEDSKLQITITMDTTTNETNSISDTTNLISDRTNTNLSLNVNLSVTALWYVFCSVVQTFEYIQIPLI